MISVFPLVSLSEPPKTGFPSKQAPGGRMASGRSLGVKPPAGMRTPRAVRVGALGFAEEAASPSSALLPGLFKGNH